MNPWRFAASLVHREGTAAEVAAEAVNRLSAHDKGELAQLWLADAIDHKRRRAAREIESGGVRVEADEADEAGARWVGQALARRAELQDLVDQRQMPLEAAVSEVERMRDQWPEKDQRTRVGKRINGMVIREFVVSSVTLDDPGDFIAGMAQAARSGYLIEHTVADEIESLRARHRARLDGIARKELDTRNRREAAGLARVGTWEDDLEVLLDLRNTLTFFASEALLQSSFVTADGRAVTWGEATRADHWSRAEMQTSHAAGTMTDAQRHVEAANLLEHEGRHCLNDIARRPTAVPA